MFKQRAALKIDWITFASRDCYTDFALRGVVPALLLIGCLFFACSAQAANDYDARVRKVEAIANKFPNFIEDYELLVEAAGICGSGDSYFVRKGQATEVELNWLRQLLRYRFNGTRVQTSSGVHIDFEDDAGEKVTEEEIQGYLTKPDFSTWLGRDLIESLTHLTVARETLIAQSSVMPQNPEDFIKHGTFKRYNATAKAFYKRLEDKFKIIAIDNLVDCD